MGRFSTNIAGTVSEFDEYSMPCDCQTLVVSSREELRNRGFTMYSTSKNSTKFRVAANSDVIDFDEHRSSTLKNESPNCTVTYSRYLDETVWTAIRLKIYYLTNHN